MTWNRLQRPSTTCSPNWHWIHESIEAFIASHPLPDDVKLIDADFWTPRQADFLKEQLHEDAEWAMVVDELNVRLHKKPE
ncbi:Uncharacterized protein ALO64_03740 [Pseudomonas meliae]|uniref:DUF2789 domain-containing protein n=1 Tax=Pseudomonas meliae TaxID=86176 RepID=A0A0P9V2L6_9PSED|nr:Uncharacterized protein ALO64_03740 [Pseudomonas meliae]